MSIGLMLLLFFLSVILCAAGGAIVKRLDIKIPNLGLIAFHVIYVTGLVAAYILL